jgi:hypothetical protein
MIIFSRRVFRYELRERRDEKGDCEADEPTANKGEIAMRKKETAKLMSVSE